MASEASTYREVRLGREDRPLGHHRCNEAALEVQSHILRVQQEAMDLRVVSELQRVAVRVNLLRVDRLGSHGASLAC